MDEHVVNFNMVGLEKIANCDLRRLNNRLLEVYSEEENVYVASRWYDDNLSFDIYKGDNRSELLVDVVSNAIGTDEIGAVAMFVRNCRRLDKDLIIGEVDLIDNTFNFRIFY